VLSSWTEQKIRNYTGLINTIVTGASAGALIAPFAFLGSAYDETLMRVFATGEMANLLQWEGLAGLFGTGLFKTEPLRELVAKILSRDCREHGASTCHTSRGFVPGCGNEGGGLVMNRSSLQLFGRVALVTLLVVLAVLLLPAPVSQSV
jgi:hypothetical protein